MQVYEIRILGQDCSTQLIVKQMNIDDHAALRSARHLAGGRSFEVWRELDCVYAGMGNVTRMPGTPSRPAA